MTTIIRVKRHWKENPDEAVILTCKRKKTEDNSSSSDGDSFEKILQFYGTTDEKDDKVAASTLEHYIKMSSPPGWTGKNYVPNLIAKQRKMFKERSEKNRWKLLSCLRSNSGFKSPDNPEKFLENIGKDITIMDVSKEEAKTGSQNVPSDEYYVYDLYTADLKKDTDYMEFNNLYKDNLLSVEPWNTDWFCDYPDEDDDEMDPDEDDSNDENNWRNDYPDSDPDSMGSTDDKMARILRNVYIDDGYELSSDSGEEKYITSKEEEKYWLYEAEDLAGRRYAKYKANAMKQIMGKSDDDEDEEDDDDDDKEEDDDDDDDFRDCEEFPSCTEDGH